MLQRLNGFSISPPEADPSSPPEADPPKAEKTAGRPPMAEYRESIVLKFAFYWIPPAQRDVGMTSKKFNGTLLIFTEQNN